MAQTRTVRDEVLIGLLEQTRLPEGEVTSRLKKAMDPAYWQQLNPNLSIGRQVAGDIMEAGILGLGRMSELLEKLAQEGYFQIEPLISDSFVEQMRTCVEVLRREHWPPAFAFVYDQFWQVCRITPIVQLLSEVLGPAYKQNSHIWCHYIVPSPGSAGWNPHIDGFNMPDRVSVWIPLSDATLENGCIYVIPQPLVPKTINDFTTLKTVSIWELHGLLQGSRALPARAGSVLGWNFQLIHWGSMVARTGHPRISIAAEFISERADPTDDERPLFDGHSTLPTFLQRLQAIGKGILEYERFEPLQIRYREFATRLVDAPALP